MNIYCFTSILTFIHNAIGYIEINGELTFDVYPINTNGANNNIRVNDNAIAIGSKILTDVDMNGDRNIKATDVVRTDGNNIIDSKVECVYQFPNAKQVEAILSDMMNQLTKIFVRAYEYIAGRDRRSYDKRYKIVNQNFDSRFFEKAYNLMSEEYRKTMNQTTNVTKLSSHDPCHHQADIKKVWQNILERSHKILKRAAVRCISDFLRVRNRADDTRTKERLGELLVNEIKEVRSNQLKVLCEDFKLCFTDLL